MELAGDGENVAISGRIGKLIPVDSRGDMELIFPPSEDSESDTSASCDLSSIRVENILDKRISIDDDDLISPLEPVRLSPIVGRKSSRPVLRSMLRRSLDAENIYDGNSLLIKKVTFPNSIDQLFSYKEPECVYPFVILDCLLPQEIVTIYENSCLKNNTIEINAIKTQLSEIRNNCDRSADLKLNNLNITYEVLETLEDILKVANFKSISIIDCVLTAGTIAVLLDMLEYYECTARLVLCIDLDQLDAWKLFCYTVGKASYLESFTLKSMNVSDINMKSLMHSVNLNQNIKSICFDSCTLIKLPNFTLIEYLESNYSVNELHLPHAGLYTREADIIGRLLRQNLTIQILDISNNLIGDRGLEHLAKGLCQQHTLTGGLSVLIVFNNQITEKSGKTVCNIIANCKNLRTLNIGFNNLTDAVISDILDSLNETESLEGLGLQSTVLTCKGASVLADAIKQNKSLKQLNLKGNKAIFIEGLEKLSRALISSKISKVELDEANRSCSDTEGYSEVVKKIKEICTINRSLVDQTEDFFAGFSDIRFRKISLNCEPYYNTSSTLPPTSSTSQSQLSSLSTCFSASPSRSRFSVSKVNDTVSKPVGNSRFKVVAVSNVDLRDYPVSKISIVEEEYDDEEEEDDNDAQFQNVRGSVSFIDSVETLTTSAIDTISDSSTPACESE